MRLCLTKKEKRLAEYIEKDGSLKIGDVCKALKTTPRTLLGVTLPGLRAKLVAHEAARLVPPTPQESQTLQIELSALREKRKNRICANNVEKSRT